MIGATSLTGIKSVAADTPCGLRPLQCTFNSNDTNTSYCNCRAARRVSRVIEAGLEHCLLGHKTLSNIPLPTSIFIWNLVLFCPVFRSQISVHLLQLCVYSVSWKCQTPTCHLSLHSRHLLAGVCVFARARVKGIKGCKLKARIEAFIQKERITATI